LKKLENGDLITSGFGEEIYFECVTCHTKLRRKLNLLRDEQVISCIKPSCLESYNIHKQGNEVKHSRRVFGTSCEQCNSKIHIPKRQVEKLRCGESLSLDCKCGAQVHIKLMPCKELRDLVGGHISEAVPDKTGI
jgi:hypothetical protein